MRSTISVDREKKPGRYRYGDGLYLQVAQGKDRLYKSWLLRFMLNGKSREMGLGPVSLVPLKDARARALECRRLLLDGIDPIDAKQARRRQQVLEAAKALTFDQCSASYIESHRAGWKNPKHADQWVNTLKTYASPVLGALPVAAIDTGLVMKVLEPIWREKAETASRLRSRIELVLSWATARGYRVGENPARWRGHLDKLLPKRSSIQRIEHHAALPVDEMGAFMKELRAQEGIAALALEFTILTAARTNESIGARWEEIDFETRTWIVPHERMKAKREHRVPLSSQAIALLSELKRLEVSPYLFPGRSLKQPLSNMAMLNLLKRMKREVTAHGFRSTFRDWAAERTNYPRDLAEKALAHVLKDKVEAAYQRGDLLEKRRPMMQDWADFCSAFLGEDIP